MRFQILANNEIKEAYSFREDSDKIYVRFFRNGKEYAYSRNNIKIIDSSVEIPNKNLIIYKFNSECYKCKQEMELITYIIFNDGTDENVVFPWDKARLLKRQNLTAHMLDSSIEYYGLDVLGGDAVYDDIVLKQFPKKLDYRYSNTTKTTYVANICPHCGSQKGNYYLYREVNQKIKAMQPIQKV